MVDRKISAHFSGNVEVNPELRLKSLLGRGQTVPQKAGERLTRDPPLLIFSTR